MPSATCASCSHSSLSASRTERKSVVVTTLEEEVEEMTHSLIGAGGPDYQIDGLAGNLGDEHKGLENSPLSSLWGHHSHRAWCGNLGDTVPP